ncbi:MAG: MFS transporter [Lentilactobacillus diolivorans]|uniref:MFS transporter n=1 Tax=Lentilactobacillus diolivorans TaxID=179838 RepID=UPI0039E736DE
MNVNRNKTEERPLWQRNLVILWFGTFMTGIGGSLISPFLSLFVDTLGNFSRAQLNLQSGVIFASTYLMTALVSPLWGKLADTRGRKPMLLRASLGMAITIFLMGFVTATWQLLVLRLLLGAFSGFVSNSVALMAIITPKAKSGRVLGMLSTGMVSGTLLGPVFGGIIVNQTGYRATFWLTGIIMLLVFLLTLFFVREKFVPQVDQVKTGVLYLIHHLPNIQVIISMLFVTLVIQLTDKSIMPVLSLYVRQLVKNPDQVTIISGIVASAPGAVMIITAPILGRLGDRYGQHRILLGGIVVSFILYLLQGFSQNIVQVIILRLLVGVSDSALAPSAQVILARFSPESATGRIFSYNQMMQSIGAVIGPLAGSTIAAYFDYRMVFLFASGFIVLNLINYLFNFKQLKQA